MQEVTYLPEVECQVSEGFLDSEYTVGVTDTSENTHYLAVNRKLVSQEGDNYYLPIGVVKVDRTNQKVLIELPREADSGANRLWIHFSSFKKE